MFNHADLQTAFPAALVWQHAVPDPDHPCCYRMSPEDSYLFTLGHMYKHYIMEGCGVRFLCDMYLLRTKQPQMNMKYVQSMVAKMGISSFHQTVIGLAEAVFAGGELTDDGRQLLNDMFSGTVYGKGKTMAEIAAQPTDCSDADLKALCTISVTDLQKAVLAALAET